MNRITAISALAIKGADGDAGAITITADEMTLDSGGQTRAGAAGKGDGGTVTNRKVDQRLVRDFPSWP
jgi:hypothetical protein